MFDVQYILLPGVPFNGFMYSTYPSRKKAFYAKFETLLLFCCALNIERQAFIISLDEIFKTFD